MTIHAYHCRQFDRMGVVRHIVTISVIRDILVGMSLSWLQPRDRGILDISLVIQGIPIEHPHDVILDTISEIKDTFLGYPHELYDRSMY